MLFVLDGKLSSGGTAPGTVIGLHLRDPLVVGGRTLAPAGTPGSLVVITTRRSQPGGVGGAVQVHLEPLRLPDGQKLPVRALHEFLTIERTASQESTRETSDTLADVFIPEHVVDRTSRDGGEMVLPAGSILRAETNATVDATDPHAVVISTPPPFTSEYDTPHSDLTPLPFYTPAPVSTPRPRGSAIRSTNSL